MAAGADSRQWVWDPPSSNPTKPVFSVLRVRTVAGKTRPPAGLADTCARLRLQGGCHPPSHAFYGDLVSRLCSATPTIATWTATMHHREREEYEPHLDNGVLVYAGVDTSGIPAPGRSRKWDITCGWRGNQRLLLLRLRLQDRGRRSHHRPGHERLTIRARLSPNADVFAQ